MPKTSTPIKNCPTRSDKPRFKSEAEEAEWYHTEAGRERAVRIARQALRKGKLVIEEKLTSREAAELAKQTGKRIILRNGASAKRTNPAVLQKLLDEARADMTQAVSLRIPIRDLEAAKALAEKKGIGYQTLLKEIIHKELRS